MERTQFTFYRSFWVAMRSLPKRDRLPFIEGVFSYIFEGTLPELSGGAAAVFTVVQPVLEASNRKAESGKQGGSKPQANEKQTASKDKDKDKDKDKNKNKDKCPPPDPPQEGGRRPRRGGNIFAEMLREGVEE